MNIALAPGTDWPTYKAALGQVLDRVAAFGAQVRVRVTARAPPHAHWQPEKPRRDCT